MVPPARVAHAAAALLLPYAERRHLAELEVRDAGHGFDELGLNREWVGLALGLMRPLHRWWFRVASTGLEHVPARGAALVACNHSGMLPIDALMVWTDLVEGTRPPRVPRVVVDFFVPRLPVISTLFTRAGAVTGTRANFDHLLEAGELVVVFPEGVAGVAKGYAHRYELQPWRVGHAQHALAHRVPVIPTAVVGAEEAWPQIARLDRFHLFGAPHLPIPATPVPLPVRLDVRYGAPIRLHERFPSEAAEDPEVGRAAAGVIRDAVQGLLDDLRRARGAGP